MPGPAVSSAAATGGAGAASDATQSLTQMLRAGLADLWACNPNASLAHWHARCARMCILLTIPLIVETCVRVQLCHYIGVPLHTISNEFGFEPPHVTPCGMQIVRAGLCDFFRPQARLIA